MTTDKDTAPANPPIGLPVFSNDGVHLGHVSAIDSADGWFKLDTPLEPDYWLELGDIQEIAPTWVLLRSRRAEVRRRKHEAGAPFVTAES